MGKFMGPQSIMLALMLLLLLEFSSLGGAQVSLYFYGSDSACSGSGYTCKDIAKQTCCSKTNSAFGSFKAVTGGTPKASCLSSTVYTSGYCNRQVPDGVTTGETCLTEESIDFYGGLTGAYWVSTCRRRRSLLGGSQSETPGCTGRMEANAIFFTEDSSEGHWILPSFGNTTDELYSMLNNVDPAEKLEWIKSQGAIYERAYAAL